MAGDERLSLVSGLWRNTDGTLSRNAGRTRRWPAHRSRNCQVAKASSRQTQVMARGDNETYPARPSARSPVLATDQPAAVAVALAVVSDALQRRPDRGSFGGASDVNDDPTRRG